MNELDSILTRSYPSYVSLLMTAELDVMFLIIFLYWQCESCGYTFLLGTFAKLRKATLSFIISVVLSVRPSFHLHGKTRFHWKDFHEIWYLIIFGKSVEEIQVSLKSYKHNGRFT